MLEIILKYREKIMTNSSCFNSRAVNKFTNYLLKYLLTYLHWSLLAALLGILMRSDGGLSLTQSPISL